MVAIPVLLWDLNNTLLRAIPPDVATTLWNVAVPVKTATAPDAMTVPTPTAGVSAGVTAARNIARIEPPLILICFTGKEYKALPIPSSAAPAAVRVTPAPAVRTVVLLNMSPYSLAVHPVAGVPIIHYGLKDLTTMSPSEPK